jgi:hypothetical protein
MRVQSPLVLRKTAKVTAATIVKDVALAFGVNLRGWRQLKRRFGHAGEHLLYDIEGAGGDRLPELQEKSRATMAC